VPDRGRVIVAFGVGLAAFEIVLWLRLSGRSNFSDFDQLWVGAQALLNGGNPYEVVPVYGYQRGLHYPLPAEFVAAPFAIFPMEVAHAAFAGVGAAALAFTLAGIGWWPVLAMFTFSTTDAIQLGQWSMLTASVAGLPWLAWLAVVKPTTGAAVALAYFSAPIRGKAFAVNLGVAFALLCGSFLLVPSWPREWLDVLATASRYKPPILYPGGFLLLLAAIRWRRAEGRLLVALACVPQAIALYETVPLALVVRTRREAMVMVAGSLAARLVYPTREWATEAEMYRAHWPILALFCYAPALVMVLRRPNVSADVAPALRDGRSPDESAKISESVADKMGAG
jgi:hypothetical protein